MQWNQFQTSVTDSFRTFRRDEIFHDVTLICEDEVQMKSHRFLLSACSSFFQKILRSTDHNQPLIFLNGVHSKQLGLILDYVYQGEVKIFQDELDAFLAVADKLKIEGLANEILPAEEQHINIKGSWNASQTMEKSIQKGDRVILPSQNVIPKLETTNFEVSFNELATFSEEPVQSMKDVGYTQNIDPISLDSKVRELIQRNEDNSYSCIVCGHSSRHQHHVKYHVETHIEGLQYKCTYCQKIFRCRRSLVRHIKVLHNSQSAPLL